jgi:hypothetical protein
MSSSNNRLNSGRGKLVRFPRPKEEGPAVWDRVKYAGLCFTVEASNTDKFLNRAIAKILEAGYRFPNFPQADTAIMYQPGTLDRAWDDFDQSSKPPFAKTREEWRDFCGGRDVRIVQFFTPMSGGQAALDALIHQWDFLCDDCGVFVGGSWGNGYGERPHSVLLFEKATANKE